jgi:hypothetical protein
MKMAGSPAILPFASSVRPAPDSAAASAMRITCLSDRSEPSGVPLPQPDAKSPSPNWDNALDQNGAEQRGLRAETLNQVRER